VLPYVALAGGVGAMLLGYFMFWGG
jgi:hypothetical protein